MALRIFYFFVLLCHFSCNYSVSSKLQAKDKPLVDEAYAMMQGSYSSSEQAEKDSNYYNISLHMYPIWTSDKDSKWLYVEQALYSNQEKPYRVRIYELQMETQSVVSSKVYKLKDQERFIGKWDEVSFFDQFDKSILEEREGCAVYLEKISEGIFSGATKDRACSSTLRGASYASSKVSVSENVIESWDQGFDSEGKQVWGATAGAYVFIKE